MRINPLTVASVAWGLLGKKQQAQQAADYSEELQEQRNMIQLNKDYYEAMNSKQGKEDGATYGGDYLPTEKEDAAFQDELFDVTFDWIIANNNGAVSSQLDLHLNPKMYGDYKYKVNGLVFYPTISDRMEVWTPIEVYHYRKELTVSILDFYLDAKDAIARPMAYNLYAEKIYLTDRSATDIRLKECFKEMPEDCVKELEEASQSGINRVPAMIGVLLEVRGAVGTQNSAGKEVVFWKRGCWGNISFVSDYKVRGLSTPEYTKPQLKDKYGIGA